MAVDTSKLPYPDPASLTEQLSNLVFALATEMKALLVTMATKLGRDEAKTTYLGITAKAASASTADSVPWSGVQDKPALGALAAKDSIEVSDVNGLKEFIDSYSSADEDYGSTDSLASDIDYGYTE
nr:MAG TPA: hypothetical protein [Caudoviricetes sp.]